METNFQEETTKTKAIPNSYSAATEDRLQSRTIHQGIPTVIKEQRERQRRPTGAKARDEITYGTAIAISIKVVTIVSLSVAYE